MYSVSITQGFVDAVADEIQDVKDSTYVDHSFSPVGSNESGFILRCNLDMDCCTPLKLAHMIPM